MEINKKLNLKADQIKKLIERIGRNIPIDKITWVFIILLFYVLLGCSVSNRNLNAQNSQLRSTILELNRIAIMDTVTVVIDGEVVSFCDDGPTPAIITLKREDKECSLQADAKGHFKFFHIQAGQYKLTAASVGHKPLKDTIVNFQSGEVWKLRIGLGCEK